MCVFFVLQHTSMMVIRGTRWNNENAVTLDLQGSHTVHSQPVDKKWPRIKVRVPTALRSVSSDVDAWFGGVQTPEMAFTSLTFYLQSNTQSWARPSSLTSLASTTPRKDAASKMKIEKHQRKVTHLKELPKNTAVRLYVFNKISCQCRPYR